MKYSHSTLWLAASLILSVGSTALAQPATAPAPTKEQMQVRYQIFVMEGVLERAVQHGAMMLSREVEAVMPDMVLLAGAARARGFRLEDYGIFFDVEVPVLRRSMAWSFRMLDQGDPALTNAIKSLRRHVQSLSDERAKQSLEQALKRVEQQVGPAATADPALAAVSGPSESRNVETSPTERVTSTRARLLEDPGEAYTAEVRDALIDAMLDHSGSITLAPHEWLTIAARDNEDRRLAPGDPYVVATLVLRVRGVDLEAFRAGRLTREEARKRVEVREF